MRSLLVPLFATCLLSTGVAAAQTRYAQPPDDATDNPRSYEPSDAFIRLGVGPALRIANDGTAGGLGLSVDVGARARAVDYPPPGFAPGAMPGFRNTPPSCGSTSARSAALGRSSVPAQAWRGSMKPCPPVAFRLRPSVLAC